MRNGVSRSSVDETRGITWRRTARALIMLALPAVLAACPPPVSNTLATVVADKLPPILTITSPGAGQTYTAAVTFGGTVTDDAVSPGDGKGMVRSIDYSVANNVLLRGKILISQDGTAQQVASYGPGVISWSHAARSFTFSFSTVTPSPIHGLVTVTVTATDANGNVTSQVVQLSEGTGPLITLTSPTDVLYTGGTTSITLTGTVANAWDDPASATNISSISWGVTGKPWGATLTGVNLATGPISVANTGFSVNQNFTYTPSTRTFTTSFVVPFINDTQLILTITATDLNGHATTSTTVLVADVSGPQLTLTSPRTGLFYSSTHFTPVTVSGIILSADVPTVKAVTYQVTGSGFSLGPVQVYTNTGTPNPANFFDIYGNFSFNLGGADLTGKHGPAQVTITIPDQFNISTVVQFTIAEDSAPPDVSDVTLTNGLSAYAKTGDMVMLRFKVQDQGSGMAGNPTATIQGTAAPLTLSGGFYSTQPTTLSALSPDGPVAFTITATDVLGNTGTVTTTPNNVTYYPGTPPLSSVTLVSNPLHPNWANAADTVSLGFTSPRDLKEKPTVVVARLSVTPEPPFSPTVHSYTAVRPMSDSDAEGPITFEISYPDAAGNYRAPVETASSITFDRTMPSGYTVNIGQTVINSGNENAMSFTFTGAEVGTRYSYTVRNGGSSVTGSGGPIISGNDTVGSIDVHALADGTLDLSVTLTDAAGNTGPAATATVNKDATPPPAFTVSITDLTTDAMSFAFAGAETGTTYTYTVTGGHTTIGPVSGQVSSTDQSVSVDVSGLPKGTVTLNVSLKDAAGNTTSAPAVEADKP